MVTHTNRSFKMSCSTVMNTELLPPYKAVSNKIYIGIYWNYTLNLKHVQCNEWFFEIVNVIFNIWCTSCKYGATEFMMPSIILRSSGPLMATPSLKNTDSRPKWEQSAHGFCFWICSLLLLLLINCAKCNIYCLFIAEQALFVSSALKVLCFPHAHWWQTECTFTQFCLCRAEKYR